MEGKFEMSGLADQQAVRPRQRSAVGVGDGEAELTRVVLSA
jgi:hypothetical protein